VPPAAILRLAQTSILFVKDSFAALNSGTHLVQLFRRAWPGGRRGLLFNLALDVVADGRELLHRDREKFLEQSAVAPRGPGAVLVGRRPAPTSLGVTEQTRSVEQAGVHSRYAANPASHLVVLAMLRP
jgi:hypothetical protein